MLESIRMFLSEYYMQLKFIHLTAVMVWVWEYICCLCLLPCPGVQGMAPEPPADQEIIRFRNWAMERFDEGGLLRAYFLSGHPDHRSAPVLGWAGSMRMSAG